MSGKKHRSGGNRQPAKKQTANAQSQRSQAKSSKATTKRGSKKLWVAAGVGVAAILAVVAFSSGLRGGAGSASGAPAEEAKYIGRLLPVGYQEPKPATRAIYTSAVQQTQVQTTDEGAAISIPLAAVTDKKIVSFSYQKQGGDAVPLIAYVKPSGKLFVGIDYCIPCKGVGQRIEPDLTLTCQTCGTKRHLETQIGVSGACKLYPLDEVPSKIAGDKLVVDKATLDAWTPQPLDRPIGG